MDAFENLVCEIFWKKGYWFQNPFYVELTKAEKRKIGRPTSPRWELDIVSYKGRDNEVILIECKSYLNSTGVCADDLIDPEARDATRYKLFTDQTLRRVVMNRLRVQLYERGLCPENPRLSLGLICGRVRNAQDRERLHKHFDKQGWHLWDDLWVRDQVGLMATGDYENSTAPVVAKILIPKQER